MSGLNFKTSSGLSGKTGSNGQFSYVGGDSVQFFLGNAPLGSEVSCEKVVTPVNVFNALDLPSSTGATNLVRLLLALDTGDNPFGLTLPGNIENNLPINTDVQSMLEDNTQFDNDADNLVEALLGTSTAVIPSVADALAHFGQSEELIDQIENALDMENLFVSVILPPGRTGEISINYNLDEKPPGVDWYTSGQSTIVNDSLSTATFSEAMYRGNWTLNLFQFADRSKVQVGDLFSFYHSDGFSSLLPSGYPLAIGSEPMALQANLTSSSTVVDSVYSVSGTIIVPRILPNGEDLSNITDHTRLTIFYDIEDGSGNSVASFNISPDISNSTSWTVTTLSTISCYVIPYSTTLPAGFIIKGQIDLFCGISGNGIADYRVWAFDSLGDALAGDITDSDYTSLSWEEEVDYDSSVQSTLNRGVMQPGMDSKKSGIMIQGKLEKHPQR